MPRAHVIPCLVCLALLVGGGCLTVPPQTGPASASDSEAATSTTTVTSGSAGQSETGIVGPATSTATSTSTSAEVTTSAASGATSEAATSSDPHSFVVWFDEGEPGDCDLYAQECPRGQKCVAYAEGGGGSWNATKCVDVVADPRQVGEPCTAFGGVFSGEDDCDLGVTCWDVDEQGHGTCVGLCGGTVNEPTCPAGTTCHFGRLLDLCIFDCDPLLQDCPGDDLCLLISDSFVCVVDGSGAEGQAHDPCELINACDKGLVCVPPASASSQCDPAFVGCCEPFCEFPGGPCPAADQQCLQWYDPQMLPPDDPKLAYGVCGVPS